MKNFVAFTLKSNTILQLLTTDIIIEPSVKEYAQNINCSKIRCGLWDTGASKSAVSLKVVKELGLLSVGEETISTSNGVNTFNNYLIDVTLPNNIKITNVFVTGSDFEDVDMLIGMDIISLGDFSITNVNNATTFTFRIPSVTEIDYVKEAEEIKKISGTLDE